MKDNDSGERHRATARAGRALNLVAAIVLVCFVVIALAS